MTIAADSPWIVMVGPRIFLLYNGVNVMAIQCKLWFKFWLFPKLAINSSLFCDAAAVPSRPGHSGK